MKKEQYLRVGLVLLLLGVCFAPQAAGSRWPGHIGYLNEFTTDQSFQQIELFSPLAQYDDSLLFFNLRNRIDSAHGYSIGLGYRQRHEDILLGGWGHYDRIRSDDGNTFHQGSFGIELLAADWDVRINGYRPERTSRRISNLNRVEIDGSSIGVRMGYERALAGISAEAGFRLPLFDDARVFAGGYHFSADGYDTISGPRLRFELRLHDLSFLGRGARLMFGGELTQDRLHDAEAHGLLQLQIPFGSFTGRGSRHLQGLERRMVEPIARESGIVLNRGFSDPLPLLNTDGQTITRVATVSADDNNDIHNRVAGAGVNSLIIADGSLGRIDSNATVVLQAGQILASAGQSLTLQFNDPIVGLSPVSFTPQGSVATLNGTNAALDVISMADDSSIAGLNVTGGSVGISVINVLNARVDNSTIRNTTSDGLYIEYSTALLENTFIADVGGDGLSILGGYVELNRSGIENSAGDGFTISLGLASISQSVISNTGLFGVAVNGSEVYIDDSSIVQAGHDGIYVVNGSLLDIRNSSVNGTGFEGLYADGSEVTIYFSSLGNTGRSVLSLFDVELNGFGNRVIGTVGTVVCDDWGANSGMIFFDDILGTGPGACP